MSKIEVPILIPKWSEFEFKVFRVEVHTPGLIGLNLLKVGGIGLMGITVFTGVALDTTS